MNLPQGVRIGLIATFAIAYPFLTAWLARHDGSGLVLALFAALGLWRALRAGRTAGRLGYGVLGIILAVAALWAEDRAARLIPAVVYLSLAWLFGHTLRHPPSLLERFVRLQFPEFKPGIAEYLRGWTWAWTVCFAAAAGICAVLALAGADRPWMVYTGVLVYVQMSLLVVAEYLYRPRRFPDLEIPPPQDSLRVLLRRGHEVFRELRQ